MIITPVLFFAYENPRPAENWSLYTGLFAPIPLADLTMFNTTLDINIPLGKWISAIPRSGLEVKWHQLGTVWRGTSVPAADKLSLWFKYQVITLPGKVDFALTPYLGAGLLVEHFADNTGLNLELGVIASSDLLPWLRVYLPVMLQLYTDGFQADVRLGLRPLIRKIHLGFDIGADFSMQSSYDFQRMDYRAGIHLQLGGEV